MLKHICHTHITFGENKDTWTNGFIEGTTSMVKLSKSKLSPKFMDIPCYMDAKQSGRIDEVRSFMDYISRDNIGFIKTGAWWNLSPTIDSMIEDYEQLKKREDELKTAYCKSKRREEVYQLVREDKDLLNLFQIHLIDFVNKMYPGQKAITEGYKEILMKDCKYFSSGSDKKVDK